MPTLNNAVATGYQGLWTDEAGLPTYTPIQNRVPRRNGIKRLMNRSQYRAISELFDTLIGAASGNAASASHAQIKGQVPFEDGGGARPIETISDISRNSTAADITMLKEMTFNVRTRPAYVKDLSGNGGLAYA